MLIQNKLEGASGTFYVEQEGKIMAELDYYMTTPENMIIEHTYVSKALRGQNVGEQLVLAAVEYARQHHIKITAVCSFTKSVFKKKPEYADVQDK